MGHSGITQSTMIMLEEFKLACAILPELVDESATVETIGKLM